MKIFYIYLSLSVLFLGCKTEVETVMIDAKALPVSAIYNVDTVYGFLQAYGEENKEFAATFHKRALNEKEQNVEKAIHDLKRSISLRPDEDVYIELAELLDQTKQYSELADLWYVFVGKVNRSDDYLFSTPDLDTWVRHYTSLLLSNGSLYSEDIYPAQEFGVDMQFLREKVLADKRLALDTSSLDYKNIWVQFEDRETLKELTKKSSIFSAFVASAEDSSNSFSIDASNICNFKYSTEDFEMYRLDLSMVFVYYLPEVVDNKNTWINYNIKHAFTPQQGLTAIVCAVDTSELGCPKEMRHIYYRLLVFDAGRNLIDHKVIAQQNGETLQLADFSGNSIRISNMVRQWKKPYVKRDLDNEVKSMVEQSTERYVISPEGKIMAESSGPGASL
jgi:hypothetical protein